VVEVQCEDERGELARSGKHGGFEHTGAGISARLIGDLDDEMSGAAASAAQCPQTCSMKLTLKAPTA
jgi:hypothetical protein